MQFKNCTTCLLMKPFSDFSKRLASPDGMSPKCKHCSNQYGIIYREKNADELSKKRKIVLNSRTEEQKLLKVAYDREYNRKNSVRINEHRKQYNKNKRKSDTAYRLSENLRSRLYKVTAGITKVGSAVHDLGCDINEFKLYIESKFQPGMTWENYGIKGWHVDHIIPLATFNLENREEFIQAAHYTNLQPLWAEDNLKKGSKVPA